MTITRDRPKETWEFEWDRTGGVFSGPQGHRVRRLCDLCMDDGYALGEPYPTRYDLADPYHDPKDLAAVLWCSGFDLPPELARAFTPRSASTPDGALALN